MKVSEEKTLESELKYKGCIINVKKDKVLLSDGKIHYREVAEHPGGVVILPILPDNRILFIKQWRHPVMQELIELPAGKLDVKNEELLEAAKRELTEETGYTAKNWEYMGKILSTPGFCNEILYFYKASDLAHIGANPDEGEIIDIMPLAEEQAWCMIKEGQIIDAKTIIGLSYLKRF